MRKRKPFTLAGIGVPAITLFLLTPVFLLALAGCGSASEPSTTAHAVRSIDWRCSDMYDDFSECVITLTDTRPPTAAGNVTGSKAGTTARSTGTSNAMTATSPTLAHRTSWKPRDGTSTEIIHATASVRTTAISHAANAASGMSDLCTGSNTRDGG